jgi:glycosyltransferase involved in cell wall biosynthesis
MEHNLQFTVVIPCYNREHLIERTVGSVLAQTFRSFEIIIVDDASTDNSVQVIKKAYGQNPKVRLIEKRVNGGVHTARNAGIDAASGAYVLFLDSDDELYPDALETFFNVLSSDSSIAIASAPYRDDDGELTGLHITESRIVTYEELLTMRVSRQNKAGVPCVRKSSVGNIRFVAPNLDYIFYRYLMRTGNTFYIARPLGLYHRVALVGNQNYERKLPKPELSEKRGQAIDAFLVDFKDDLVAHAPELFAGYAYSASVGLLLGGHRRRALIRAFEALWYSRGKFGYIAFFILCLLPFATTLLWLFFSLKIRYTKARKQS